MNMFEDKKAVYYTLGCKLNFAETSTVGAELKARGVRTARKGEIADICVVNTCSVTEVADSKCRQAIHRLVRNHPGAIVVVTDLPRDPFFQGQTGACLSNQNR